MFSPFHAVITELDCILALRYFSPSFIWFYDVFSVEWYIDFESRSWRYYQDIASEEVVAKK